MVELTENLVDDNNHQTDSCQQEEEEEEMIENPDEEIDFTLVEEARDIISAEYKENSDKYCPVYYEEIMNPKSADTCWRFLVYSEKKVNDAIDFMKSALSWRKEAQVEDWLRNDKFIKEFWLFAPVIMFPSSRIGQDVICVIGKGYRKPINGEFKPFIKRFIINMLITWDKKNQLNKKKLLLVFDVRDTGLSNIDLEFISWLITIFDYIPSRMAQIHVVGVPFILRPIVRMIISWLPRRISSILLCGTVVDLIEKNIEPEKLPGELGGLREDFRYRLAPLDAKWAKDTVLFSDPKVYKQMEDSIMFNTDQERREHLIKMQAGYENENIKKNKQ